MISRTEAVACWAQGLEAGGGGVHVLWGNEYPKNLGKIEKVSQ